MLDAHGATLRVDSYGQIIDAPNRAIVELKAGQGTLRLDGGARIDLRAGATTRARTASRAARWNERAAPERRAAATSTSRRAARWTSEARAVAVNGVWVDCSATPAPKPLPAASYQIIDQDYLDRLHDDSRAFITQALANANLVDGKLAGLRYADALHLRPGIEIRSATPEGDLVVQGDLDLSRYRYASLNPHTR